MSAANLPCSSDFDCPLTQICYANVTHLPTNYTACFCNGYYGWTNETSGCTVPTSTYFFLMISLSSQAILCASLALMSFTDAVRVLSIGWTKIQRASAIILTSVSLPFALTALFMWRLAMLGSTLSPDSANVVSDHEVFSKPVKYAKYEVIQRPVVFLCLLLTAICVGSLSLMWISVAERVRSMQIQSVSSWREQLFLFSIFFFISMGVVAISIDWSITGPTALPFLLILIGMLVAGRSRMLKLLRSAVRFERQHSSVVLGLETARSKGSRGAAEQSARKEERTMLAISRAGLHIIIGACGIFVSGVASFLLSGVVHPGGWREFSPIGQFSWITAVHELLPFFTLYILCAVFFYVHRNTNKLLHVNQSSVATSSAPAVMSSSANEYTNKLYINPLTIEKPHNLPGL